MAKKIKPTVRKSMEEDGFSYARDDNKPMSTRELVAVLLSLNNKGLISREALDKPVTLPADAEGNAYHGLQSIEVLADGSITLWPTHEEGAYR